MYKGSEYDKNATPNPKGSSKSNMQYSDMMNKKGKIFDASENESGDMKQINDSFAIEEESEEEGMTCRKLLKDENLQAERILQKGSINQSKGVDAPTVFEVEELPNG